MKLFEKTQVIVYRVEESLNLYDGKKKLDKVVSGRILKSTTKLFGFGKTKYKYEVNIPMFDKEDAQTKERLQEVLQSVVQKCEAKIKEWRKNERIYSIKANEGFDRWGVR